jgi:hypothetical protein
MSALLHFHRERRTPGHPQQQTLDALGLAHKHAFKLLGVGATVTDALERAGRYFDHPSPDIRAHQVMRLRLMRDALRRRWIAVDQAIEGALASMEGDNDGR